MQWQYSPYVLALVLAAAVSGNLAFFAWRRRRAPGAWPAVLLLLAVTQWSLGYALELGSANLEAQVFWAKFEYLGIVSVPLMWLLLALDYTGAERLITRRNLFLLAIIPVATLLLAWTNELHGLIWKQIGQDSVASSVVLDLTYGVFFWVNLIYSYVLLVAGSARFLLVLIRSPQLYRGQAGGVLLAVLAPWIGNALYVTDVSPFPHLDLTPFAFTVSGLALAWAMFRFRLLDFVPIAREAVIQGMGDSVIVLDARGRIADLNPSAERLIGRASREVVGQEAGQVLPGALGELERYHSTTETHSEIVLRTEDTQRTYDLLVSPLLDRRARLVGQLLLLHDISEHIQTEQALRRRAVQLETAARVAREATTLPDVAQVLTETVRLISSQFGFYHAGIFLLDEAGEYAVLRAASSEGGRRMVARGHRLKVGEEGIVGYATGQGEPRVALDVGEDAVFFDNPDLPETRSEVALPLRVRGEVIGALDVQSMEPGAFGEEDVTVLQTLADQVAVAISNARLFHRVQESLEAERRAFGQMSLDAWRELSRSKAIVGQRYDPQHILPTDRPLTEEMRLAAQEGRSVSAQDSPTPALVVPLKVRGQVIGVLDAHKPAGAGYWTDPEVALLQELVDHLGVALESARLYEDAQRRAARDRLISQVTTRMRETLDVRRVLETAVDELYQTLGLDKVVVRLARADDGGSA